MRQLYSFILFVLLVSAIFAESSWFQHSHDEDDADLEILGAHISSQAYTVSKTCFPVTMEVCLPSGGNSNRSTPSSPSPAPAAAPSAPAFCGQNDFAVCPDDRTCLLTPNGVGCQLPSTGMANVGGSACSWNCRQGCQNCTSCEWVRSNPSLYGTWNYGTPTRECPYSVYLSTPYPPPAVSHPLCVNDFVRCQSYTECYTNQTVSGPQQMCVNNNGNPLKPTLAEPCSMYCPNTCPVGSCTYCFDTTFALTKPMLFKSVFCNRPLP